ncbi:unnamed protein product [marine sediment metagenome]|uniref:Uncharacterized protein n=1 Tax=marine sediment metagenome TaxID=412755 RepID=X1JE22_9ZZZZ
MKTSFMICDVCKKRISGKPIIKEIFMSLGDGIGDIDNDVLVKHFCSIACERIDDILEHALYFGRDQNIIITHLINAHGCDIKQLELVLNSGIFKKLWGDHK